MNTKNTKVFVGSQKVGKSEVGSRESESRKVGKSMVRGREAESSWVGEADRRKDGSRKVRGPKSGSLTFSTF
jgi:hypothetical protein